MSVNESTARQLVDPGYEMDIDVEEMMQERQDAGEANEDNGPRHEDDLDKHGLRPVSTTWVFILRKYLRISKNSWMRMDVGASILFCFK